MTIITAPWQFIITQGDDADLFLRKVGGYARGDIARFTAKDATDLNVLLGLWLSVSGVAHTPASCQAMKADRSYNRPPIYDFAGIGSFVNSDGNPLFVEIEPLPIIGVYDTGTRTGGFNIDD